MSLGAGFNLPPGCRVADIPGNRPEDADAEAAWLDFHVWLDNLSVHVELDTADLKRLVSKYAHRKHGWAAFQAEQRKKGEQDGR
jgi:hypothetical protein